MILQTAMLDSQSCSAFTTVAEKAVCIEQLVVTSLVGNSKLSKLTTQNITDIVNGRTPNSGGSDSDSGLTVNNASYVIIHRNRNTSHAPTNSHSYPTYNTETLGSGVSCLSLGFTRDSDGDSASSNLTAYTTGTRACSEIDYSSGDLSAISGDGHFIEYYNTSN
jgi:hypothetical protein